MPAALRLTTPDSPWTTSTAVPKKLLDPAAADAVLADWFNGDLLPFGVAAKHGLTLDELIAFIRSDPAVQRQRELEELALDRARAIAALHLPAAIQRLASVVLNHESHPPAESRRAATALLRHHHRLTTPPRRGAPPPHNSPPPGAPAAAPSQPDALPAPSSYTRRFAPSNGHPLSPEATHDTHAPTANGHKTTPPRAASPPRRR
jgi:hypothetical protein